MKAKKALEILKERRESLKSLKFLRSVDVDKWNTDTEALIRGIWGNLAAEYARIVHAQPVPMRTGDDAHTVALAFSEAVRTTDQILQAQILSIEQFGLPKQVPTAHGNFLSRMDNFGLLSALCAVGVSVFGIGYWFGEWRHDIDSVQQVQVIEALRATNEHILLERAALVDSLVAAHQIAKREAQQAERDTADQHLVKEGDPR